MKEIILLSITFFSHSFLSSASAQEQNLIDSLETQLKKISTGKTEPDLNDTLRANILFKLSSAYTNLSPGKSLDYAGQLLNLSNKIGYKRGIGNAYVNMGVINFNNSEFIQSINFFKMALKISGEMGSKRGISVCSQYLGHNYWRLGNFPESIKNYLVALKIDEEMGNKTGMCNNYNGIGVVCLEQGTYTEAMKNFSACLKLAVELNNKDLLEQAYNNIGIIYQNQGNYQEAKKSLLLSLKYSVEIGNAQKISASYIALSDFYFQTNNYAESLNYAFASLEIDKKAGYKEDPSWAYLFIGRAYAAQKIYKDATNFLTKALSHSKMSGDLVATEKCYSYLATLDSSTGNYKQALAHYKMFVIMRDSVFNDEKIKKTVQLQMQYEFDKKEDSLKQKQIITETKLQAQKKQKYFYWIGLALLGLLSFFIFLTFRNQKKINRLAGEFHAKEKAELELQSLRAQLNPHFMFNSLNAIQELILLEENEKSQSYLARFAKLLRMLLENAERPFIPLQREIDFLRLYLSLENLRIPDLHYTINVDPGIDTEQTAIPNMILQPYIENAIWHGLSHKKEDKNVQIRITKINGVVQYEIEDNGVGRKKADELKSLFRKEHKSKGMELLSKRFKLLSKEYGSDIETAITDVLNNGEVAGTQVTIKVPGKLSSEMKNQQP